MTLLPVLVACVSAGESVEAAKPPADDSGNAPGSGDSAHLPREDARLGSFGAASDVRILPCGTRHDSAPPVVTPGPDLDGDGLGELAVGIPSADGMLRDSGVVLLYAGARLAEGPLRAADAHASVTLTDAAGAPIPLSGFGSDLRWLEDRDGDGVDDLWAGAAMVSGARLLAGGSITVESALDPDPIALARWDDVDGDGRDDWIAGFSERGIGGAAGSRGAIGAVPDTSFDGSATPLLAREAVGLDASAEAGQAVAVLGQDLDRDGVREVVTTLGHDVVVLNSRALLDWATYVDEAVRGRMVDGWGVASRTSVVSLLVLGDVDGGGVDDLATLRGDGGICIARGEDVVSGTAAPRCDLLTRVHTLVLGEDLDGDGHPEVWAVRSSESAGGEIVAVDAQDLLAGFVTIHAAISLPEDSVRPVLTAGNGQVHLTGASRVAWAGEDLTWSAPQRAGATADDLAPLLRSEDVAEPGVPVWVDLDTDGVLDLVLEEADGIARPEDGAKRLHVYTGESVRAGGTRNACEADRVLVPTLDGVPADVRWIEGGDALLSVSRSDGTWSHALVPAGAIWTGDVEAVAVRFTGPALTPAGCDLTGDGVEEVVRRRNDTLAVLDPVRLRATSDPSAAELGAVPDDDGGADGCLPGVAGGGDVLLTYAGRRRWLGWRAADLRADAPRTATDAWLVLDGSTGSPYWNLGAAVAPAAWLPEDIVVEVVTGTDGRGSQAFATCSISPETLAAGGTLSAALGVNVCGAPGHLGSWAAWSADLVGDDGVRDPVAVVRDAITDDVVLRAWDASTGVGVLLSPVASQDGPLEVLAAGPAPDLLGAGSPGAWVLTRDERNVRGVDVGRPLLELTLAR